MKRSILAAVLIGLVAAGATAPAVRAGAAGEAPPPPAERIGRLMLELQLSGGQKKEIAEVVTGYRDGNRELIRRIVSARRELAAAIHGGEFDEISVRASARVAGDLAEEMAVRRARQSGEIRALLTDQQRELLREAGEGLFEQIEERIDQACFAVDLWAARQAGL